MRKQGGGSRRSTDDGGEGNEPAGGKASTRGRPERAGERPDTGPGISASRTRPGPSGGATLAPYPVHGVAAPCRRGRAIARVSAAAARGQRRGRRNDGGEIRTQPGE